MRVLRFHRPAPARGERPATAALSVARGNSCTAAHESYRDNCRLSVGPKWTGLVDAVRKRGPSRRSLRREDYRRGGGRHRGHLRPAG